MRGLVFCALPLSSTDLFSSVNCILCVYFVAPLYIYNKGATKYTQSIQLTLKNRQVEERDKAQKISSCFLSKKKKKRRRKKTR